MDGDELRKAFDSVGIQYGPAFSGLAAVHVAEGDVTTVLAEVALPGLIRSQQAAYLSHPALLDACFQSVIVHPDVQAAGAGGLLLPVGVRRLRCYHPTRNAHYCLTRVTASRAGECEADLEVLDQSGTVLMTVEGLRLAAGGSEQERAESTAERATADHRMGAARPARRRARPAPGAWLLLSTSDAADPLATGLTDALTAEGASCTTVSWPLGAERLVDAGPLRHPASAAARSPRRSHRVSSS